MDFNAEVEKIVENKVKDLSDENEELNEQLRVHREELKFHRDFTESISRIYGVEVDKYKLFSNPEDLKNELDRVMFEIKKVGRDLD